MGVGTPRMDRTGNIATSTTGPEGPGRATPWVFSFMLHAGLIAIGMLVTWTVILVQERDAPRQITADFDALAYEPVVEFEITELDSPTEAVAPSAIIPAPPVVEAAAPGDTVESTQLIGQESAVETNLFAEQVGEMPVIEFAGSRATNASRIIYVIDASGSLTPYLQIVLNEMFRSLRRLDDRQQFAIIFFQEDRAVPVPPTGRLQRATDNAKDRAIDWINSGTNVVPGYGSNPMAALEMAFDLHPEVVFLLSDSITGSGAYEVDQELLLSALEELNPVVDDATGRRDVQVNCIQFLGEDEDRLGTMKRIAELHGGDGGYRVFDRKQMGLEE